MRNYVFQYNILNNVLERNSRSSESLNFISLKNYILETKVFEGKIAKTDPHKKRNSFKNGRLSAICYTEINLKNIRQMHFLGVFLHEGRENIFYFHLLCFLFNIISLIWCFSLIVRWFSIGVHALDLFQKWNPGTHQDHCNSRDPLGPP